MQAHVMKGGRSARTARMARIVLASALGDAVRDGLVARNAAKLARPPRVERPELRVLGAEQVRRFLTFTADHPDGPLYALAVSSGLRQGELLGLSWTDVDLEAGQLTVRRSLARNADGNFSLSAPKTQRSRRTIALPAVGVDALRRQRQRLEEMRGVAGSAWQDRDDLVFTDVVGRPLMGYNVTRDFSKSLEEAGLPHVRFHDLRHTMATLAIGSGASLRTVSDALGHSSITVTADVYAHVTPEMKREVAVAIGRALGVE
jgi:integrase